MKKHLFSFLMVLALLLALFPVSVSVAADEDNEYAIDDVSIEGASVRVIVTATADCTLCVGLYDKSGKMTAAQSQPLNVPSGKVNGKQTFVDFGAEINANLSAKAFLLDTATFAPLCISEEFSVDNYVLIQRITIENKNGVHVSSSLNGTAPMGVQAVVRISSGARKTFSLDDSKNYRDEVNGTALDATAIDYHFRAGRIVRLSKSGTAYRLHAVDDRYMFTVPNFTIDGKNIWSTTQGKIETPQIKDNSGKVVDGGETLIVDSETHFTVQDTKNSTYKSYVGTKNVPIVSAPGGTAYIYHDGTLAKLIFITEAENVSSGNIIFLVAPSTSTLVESYDGNYYDVLAIDKGEIKTLRIKAGTVFTTNGSYFQPGSDIANTKNEGNCVLLNKIAYDSYNLVSDGSFVSENAQSYRAIGIRRIKPGEVCFDTYSTHSYLRNVAENVRVFYINGNDVKPINYEDIIDDTKDAIYYVEEYGVVTHIFIVNYEGADTPLSAVNPNHS